MICQASYYELLSLLNYMMLAKQETFLNALICKIVFLIMLGHIHIFSISCLFSGERILKTDDVLFLSVDCELVYQKFVP
jgi:hypothetical protein